MSKFKIFLFVQFVFFSNLPVLAQVDTVWVRRYQSGAGALFEEVHTLAVDKGGNVFVTGSSLVSGRPDYDYTTIKYSPKGETLCVRHYNGPGNSYDNAKALVVDDSGNVYVTGYSWTSEAKGAFATIKYSLNGDTLWVRRYDGTGISEDVVTDLVVDGSGNVYVTGHDYNIGGNGDPNYVTIKYAPNGDSIWLRIYDRPGYYYTFDYATALAVDDSGNVYVTGYSSEGAPYDYATIKYGPNGDTLWVRIYNGPGPYSTDKARDLVVGDNGNVYVTGYGDGAGTDYDYVTIKYAPNGDSLWLRRYSEPGYSSDYALALAVDDNENVYVTGYSWNGTSNDYTTIKYAPSGDMLWLRRYNGPGDGSDGAAALAVDNSGNVYVTGNSYDSANGSDYATIKYSPNGETLAVVRYSGPGSNYDRAIALAVDDSGNVYVTGNSWNGNSYDYATIKYRRFGCLAKSGDANNDGKVDLSDIMFNINYLIKDGPSPFTYCAGDADGDGSITFLDIIYQVNYIFKGGATPRQNGVCCL